MIHKRGRNQLTHEKTNSISFRYSIDLIEALNAEASEKEISLNVLTRQILQKHVEWDRYATIMGMVQVPHELISFIGTEMKDDTIDRIIDILHPKFKDWVMFMKGTYDLKNSLEILEEYMNASYLSSDHRIEGNIHHFIIQHNLGITWSLFLERFLKRVIMEFLPGKPIQFKTTDNVLSTTIALGEDFNLSR